MCATRPYMEIDANTTFEIVMEESSAIYSAAFRIFYLHGVQVPGKLETLIYTLTLNEPELHNLLVRRAKKSPTEADQIITAARCAAMRPPK